MKEVKPPIRPDILRAIKEGPFSTTTVVYEIGKKLNEVLRKEKNGE